MGAALKRAWRVEGMDCASCVAKVTKAVERLPGVSAVEVNLIGGRLSATIDGGAEAAEAVSRQVAALGYTVQPLTEARPTPAHESEAACNGHCSLHPRGQDHGTHDHAGHDASTRNNSGQGNTGHARYHHDDRAEDGTPWYATAKARLVWLLGALVGGAYGLSLALPAGQAYPLSLAATLVAIIPFGRRAFALARAGSPFSIETLLLTAALGAVAIGAAEEAAIVVLLFAVGELLESVAAGRARDGIRALAGLLPRVALRLRADGTTEQVQPEALAIGELVLVRPGDRVPCDGVIAEGHSALDESPVTGESAPVARGPGDAVRAGSINADGAFRVRVTRAAADNTIARIIRMVEDATASRAPTQRFIERFAAWWTPGAMIVAVLVILGAPFALGWSWETSLYRGLAVLLIACPCALVISVPAAMASGLSAGARHGLLIKGGAALEAIGQARSIAFDKTGTLTAGRPRVTDLLPAEGRTAVQLLALAAAVERGSAHPLARAILAEAAARGAALQAAEAQSAIPGRGVAGTVAGRRVSIGSPRHAREAGAVLGPFEAETARLEAEGKTVAVVLVDGAVAGLLALRDEPRDDAAPGIAAIAALGPRPVMLTGDNRRTGEAIAASLGIEARAEMLPEDKLREIAALRAAGAVVMVGDGINDAPALAAADVGVAMGGGTDVALETADAAVLKDRVGGVAELVALSRATMRNVRQNVALAVGLKGLFLVTTMAGVTGLWPAILADTGATVLVTLNALRLLRWTPSLAFRS